MGVLLLALWMASAPRPGFGARQALAPRVAAARAERGQAVRAMFAKAGVGYPASRLFIRSFKAEALTEVWAADAEGPLRLIDTIPTCASSGVLGPKRRRGDLQVPEGFYRVDKFNPSSAYHLALGIDYPNASDRILGHKADLGGDIMIHGDCVTIGCIPLTDARIEAVYLAAVDTYAAGGEIPVHIFPTRLDEGWRARLAVLEPTAEMLAFWEGLVAGYRAFEETRQVPRVRVDAKTGAYRITAVTGG